MYNILMLGAQGSGKGTQATRLASKLGIPTVSIGKLFRMEIDKKTPRGLEIASYTDKGDRVPNDIVNQLMIGRLAEQDTANGAVLDGFPRTLDQKDALDVLFAEHGRALTHVIYLQISDEESMRRLSGRWVCSNSACEENYHRTFNPPKKDPSRCDTCGSALIQRDDDKPAAIIRRLELYHKDTQPLIDHYRERGILYEVNGEQEIARVETDIDIALEL